MKRLRIAFLYNVRHVYPDPNDPKSQLETDFDDPETIEKIITHFKNAGYDVLPIEANEDAYEELHKNRDKIDLAFNLSEGLRGDDRECHIPAMLEMLNIPYTGSTPLTQALVLDKAKTKEILLCNDVPTLPFQVFRSPTDALDTDLHFPLIVKPIAQGSSAGITNKSVVFNDKELRAQLHDVYSIFHKPILVEPYMEGREFSVGMIGNPPRILPIIEPDHSKLPKGYHHIDSLEVKWIFEEETDKDYLVCPAKMSAKLRKKVEEICLKTWTALDIRDVCRIDIRCDEDENPFVLEVNSPAGLLPPEISCTSYLPLAARTAGIEYEDLLRTIIDAARKRISK